MELIEYKELKVFRYVKKESILAYSLPLVGSLVLASCWFLLLRDLCISFFNA